MGQLWCHEISSHTCVQKSVIALWARSTKNPDCSTGPLARPFARSLAPLTRSLAPDCSLCSRPPLRSLVRSLAHFARSPLRSLPRLWDNERLDGYFFCVFYPFWTIVRRYRRRRFARLDRQATKYFAEFLTVFAKVFSSDLALAGPPHYGTQPGHFET